MVISQLLLIMCENSLNRYAAGRKIARRHYRQIFHCKQGAIYNKETGHTNVINHGSARFVVNGANRPLKISRFRHQNTQMCRTICSCEYKCRDTIYYVRYHDCHFYAHKVAN